MRGWALVIATFALAGCTSATQIAENPGHIETVVISRPYQDVYRDVRTYSKRCLESGAVPFFSADVRVDAEMYSDEKRGTIEVYMPTPRTYLMRFEIGATAPDATKLVIKHSVKPLLPLSNNAAVSAAKGSGISCNFQ